MGVANLTIAIRRVLFPVIVAAAALVAVIMVVVMGMIVSMPVVFSATACVLVGMIVRVTVVLPAAAFILVRVIVRTAMILSATTVNLVGVIMRVTVVLPAAACIPVVMGMAVLLWVFHPYSLPVIVLFRHQKSSAFLRKAEPDNTVTRHRVQYHCDIIRQVAFCGRYLSTPHTAGLLTYGSTRTTPSRFRNDILWLARRLQ